MIRYPKTALLIVTILAYFPAIFAGFIWDDPDYVVNNMTLRSAAGLVRMWTVPTSLPQWYPLVHTSFWIEMHFWRFNPMGYHVDNILLQALGAILLWRLLSELQIPGAWLAAAMFAVHPIHVESVAWITERKNTLSTVFYFAAALAYLRVMKNPAFDWKAYGSVIGLFLAALLSKTVVCTFPAAILLFVYFRNGRITPRDVWPTIPLFLLGIGTGLFTAMLERTHVHAVGPAWDLSFAQRTLIAGRAIWFYAGKIVCPWPLAFIYARWSVWPIRGEQFIPPITAVAVLIALWMMRSRIGRGPFVAVAFFVGTLFPALGFFNTFPMRYSFVADHFQHLASVGLTTLIAVGIVRCRDPIRSGLTVGVMAICIALSFMQSRVYADAGTLWRDTLAKTPGSWMVYTNLARALETEGRMSEANVLYEKSATIAPNEVDTQHNLGEVRMMQGRIEESDRAFHRALAIDPRYESSWLGLAKLAFFARHDSGLAKQYFAKCFEIDPGYGAAHFADGQMLESIGDVAGAAEQYRLATIGRPDDFDAFYNFGTVRLKMNDAESAIDPLRHALLLKPKDGRARTNLIYALHAAGQNREADELQREALRALNP